MIGNRGLINNQILIIITLAKCCLEALCDRKERNSSLIYILDWTPPGVGIHDKGSGQDAFINRKCKYQNCFLTTNHSYFTDVLDYDVFLFNSAQLHNEDDLVLPPERSPDQTYIMVSTEPAGAYTIPKKYNGFFNITWTYRISSDIPLPYIVVRNEKDEEIGPKIDMKWIDVRTMRDTDDTIKKKLQDKKIAAAWFASNCNANLRLYCVEDIQRELAKYGHRVDIYGDCGDYECTRSDECYSLLESDYYFYFAFENSFDEDYVTEKLLTALEHFVVPVVYGSANYSRFMPKGIYLNAYTLGAEKVAQRMVEIINDKNAYYNFFKWHGYYSFHGTYEDRYRYSREVCALCEVINRRLENNQRSAYDDITSWWSAPPQIYPGRHGQIAQEEKPQKAGALGFAENLYNYLFEDMFS